MSSTDQIQRFIFEHSDIRGVLAGLDNSYREVLSRHDYPPTIQRLLGEMLAATSLLSTTLKFDGRLTLQARGKGNINLLMTECNHHRMLRGIARWQLEVPETDDLNTLLNDGHLAITIEPDIGRRYQGIVSMEKGQLSRCLEDYFMQSEQLNTHIRLLADGEKSSGLLLQALPSQKKADEKTDEDWFRITQLAATLTNNELLNLDNSEILHRLYHEEEVRLFEPSPLSFGCDCSRERSLGAIKSIGQAELEGVLKEQGVIAMQCQFCNQQYQFGEADVALLFSAPPTIGPSGKCH